MSLISWRKLQAGLSGQGDAAARQTVVQHTAINANETGTSFDTLIVNNLVVHKTFKQPVGTDKYK